MATDFEDVTAQVGEDGMSVVLSGTVSVDKLTYSDKTFTSEAITLTVNGGEGKTAKVALTYDAKQANFPPLVGHLLWTEQLTMFLPTIFLSPKQM